MEEILPVDEGAEAFIELLNANGVDYLFLNPGTDTYPVQEAISKYRVLGKHTPEVVLCLHESVGMSAAYGHFMVSGKPQVVLVHTDVGLQQVGGALHNAQRGRTGVVLCAGRVPSNIEGNKRTGRSFPIQWLQEQFDPAGIVRGYVKWDYELRSNENIHHVVQRAFQVASSEPCGPVYLSLPQNLLMEKITSVHILDVDRYTAISTPQADTALLERIASLLMQAETPLIITGYSGRYVQSVVPLIELAETTGARLITSQYRMNFPTTHPLCGGFDPAPYLKEADVILIIDSDAPYVPAEAKFKPDTKIVHMDIDPVKQNMPMWGFPADIFVQSDSGKAIPVLNRIIGQKSTPERQAYIQSRSQRLQDEHLQMREEWRQRAIAKAAQRPISPEWLCNCINEVIDADTLVLEEAVTNRWPVLWLVNRTRPGTFFTSGGSNLGWGLGAALGAKLANPDRTVVTLVGDGSFVFGCPTAALWAASVYHAPFLCIIFNNMQFHAPKWALQATYGKESFSEKSGLWIGVDITPPPDYAAIAGACYAYGHLVEDPAELKSALKAALEQVRGGRPAVVDVRIESP